MKATALAAPILITRPDDLRKLVNRLAQLSIVAVDTESNSLFAYREQVCLVQFSTGEADYLVDPLALGDLSPLGPIFSSPQIEKVFHAAEYDVLCLRRDYGFEFARLFDTMVASRILGREAVGLGSMLQEMFNVRVDKRFQRADWGERPLPKDALDYARMDTHYLIELRHRLRAELEQYNLLALAEEDFARLANYKADENGASNGTLANGDPAAVCWRISGAYDLQPQQAAVLLELCRYREKSAQAANRPRFKVIGDQTLKAIAEQTPTRLEDLQHVPGMTSGQVRRHGKHLLEAVQYGLQSDPFYPPRNPRPNERYLHRMEALRHWRKEAADKMGVQSDVILPRDLLHSLAENAPQDKAALAALLWEVPWRLERFGAQILDILNERNR